MPDKKNPKSPSQSPSSSKTSASSPKKDSQRSTPVVKDLQPRKDPSGGSTSHGPKGDY